MRNKNEMIASKKTKIHLKIISVKNKMLEIKYISYCINLGQRSKEV